MPEEKDLLYRSADEIREIQDRNFRHQMSLVLQGHPYYKERLKQYGFTPDDFKTVDDIEKLPLTFKSEYMKNPMAFRLDAAQIPELTPYERILWDLTYTTGTTAGQPTPFFNTTYDHYANLVQLERTCQIAHITAEDVIVNVFPLTPVPHIGFIKTREFATIVGAPIVCALTGTPHPEFPVHKRIDYAVELALRHNGTLFSGIVSYIRRVIMRAEEMGVELPHIRQCFVLGEPCPRGMRNDMRRRLEKMGANNPLINNGLGFTEMQGTCIECTELGGAHNPSPDLYFFEIVDEQTGKRLPDGERGLFVVTHLNRRGTVLLRYVLGDITSLSHEQCPHCGRQGPRVVTNVVRTMELVKFKGTLINPDVLKEAIATVDGIEEYQIVFTKEDAQDPYSLDKLALRVAAPPAEHDRIQRELQARVQEAVEMRATVEFTDKTAIFDPAKTLKSTRVVDQRPKEE